MCGSAFDQRGLGYPRIFDDPELVNAFDGSDIGAYELQQACGGPLAISSCPLKTSMV